MAEKRRGNEARASQLTKWELRSLQLRKERREKTLAEKVKLNAGHTHQFKLQHVALVNNQPEVDIVVAVITLAKNDRM